LGSSLGAFGKPSAHPPQDDPSPAVHEATAEQRKALAHPTRHRITLALRTPATVSALARDLRINKGNVAHHVAVLDAVGLVRRVGTRTGRGGTQTLYESVGRGLRFEGREANDGMLQVVGQCLVDDPDDFAFLRRVRLTPAQARHLAQHLEDLVAQVPDTSGAPAVNVFVSVVRD
jgi:DNA-binding transcriptional ArsR family regulator